MFNRQEMVWTNKKEALTASCSMVINVQLTKVSGPLCGDAPYGDLTNM